MNNDSFLSVDNMRIEIAILQEDIPAFEPSMAKFKIPAIMTEDTVARMSTSNTNIYNKRNANLGSTTIDIDNSIDFYVPFEYSFSYGLDTVPKGTKFLVAFIGANINDGKIIGRYDKSSGSIANSIAEWIIEVIDLDNREEKILKHSDDNDVAISNGWDIKIANIRDYVDSKYRDSGTDMAEFKADIERQIIELKRTLTQLIENAKDLIDEKIAFNNETISGNMDQLRADLIDIVNGIKDNIYTDMDTMKSDIGGDIETLREEYKESLNSAYTDIESRINEVRALIDSINEALEEATHAYDDDVLDLRNEIKKRIAKEEEILTVVESYKDFLLDESNKNKNHLGVQISELEKAYKAADALINIDIAKLREDHNALVESVEEMNDALSNSILEAKNDAIKTAEDYSDEKLAAESKNIRDAYHAADVEIIRSIDSLDTKVQTLLYGVYLEDLKNFVDNRYQQAMLYTDEELVKAKEELTTYVDETRDKINEVVEELTTTVKNNKESLEKLVATEVETLNTRIDTEVTTMNKNLDDAETRINKRTDAVVNDHSNKLGKEISDLAVKIDEGLGNLGDDLLHVINVNVENLQSNIDNNTSDIYAFIAALRSDIEEKAANNVEMINNRIDMVKYDIDQTIRNIEMNLEMQIKEIKMNINRHELWLLYHDKWIAEVERTANLALEIAIAGFCSC